MIMVNDKKFTSSVSFPSRGSLKEENTYVNGYEMETTYINGYVRKKICII